jgi:taurine--2-oxoglutarate transaminase
MTEIVVESKKRGLMPFTNFNRMHVVPPATVTESEAKEGLAIIDEVFSIVDAHYTGA